MNWLETTLRKGTKSPKICRDMFITDSKGDLKLVVVKNGRMEQKSEINNIELWELVHDYNLIERASGIFANCSTYRTFESWKLIDEISCIN